MEEIMKRFNWVDITILVIVFLAVVLLAWSFLGGDEEEVTVAEGGDLLSVTFLATDLDLSTAEAVVQSLQGADLPFEGTMYPPTRIFNSDKMLEGATTGGMVGGKAKAFTDREKLVACLKRTTKPGDVILFKGSRGMHMELALEQFLADFFNQILL